ncbi:hypothetical protein MKQ70_11445 [Chitinophaga sedimenti]|uniref:hypothetical protein n=1 Tax=Chitinophaga sedimenti TaxID=2033606 RepID=UPI0020053015|nr:hypothetical protein [Chitinophaga sedimenti]MCK7555592.1 hypothetical protein [Chitinophaga sedimenti]
MPLEGFQINQYRGIQCGYSVQRLHDGSLRVTVHQPLDQFHHQVHDLQFRAIAVFPDFQGGNTAVASSETVLLNDVQAKGITAFCLTIPATQAGAAVVILETTSCIIEHGKPLPMRNRKHNAADIIAVVPPVKEQGIATSGLLPRIPRFTLPSPPHRPKALIPASLPDEFYRRPVTTAARFPMPRPQKYPATSPTKPFPWLKIHLNLQNSYLATAYVRPR